MAIIPPKGESEITRTSTETNVLIPWRITQRIGVVCVVLVLCLYLTIWGIVWFANDRDFEPILRHLVKWWLAWLLPVLFAFVFPFIGLVVYDYLPRLRNANWPPPWAQVEPQTGFIDAYHWKREEQEPPEQERIIIEGIVHDTNGKSVRTVFETRNPERWRRYLKALVTGPPALRPGLSVRAATNIFYRINRAEFEMVCEQWLRIGYARKTSDARNAKRYLTAKGVAFARAWSERADAPSLTPEAA